MIVRPLAALVWLCLLSQGCTTDVVDFPTRSLTTDAAAGDTMAPDTLKWICTTSMTKKGNRCTTCKHPTSGSEKTDCEVLMCKTKPYDDAGTSGCKICSWSNHPKEMCKICWGSLEVDTCSGKDAGI